MATQRRRRGRGGARRTPMSEINVTPLVDVMMVLLVIFMVTAPLLKAGIAIQLPDSRAKPLEQSPHGVTITMDRAGKTYWDDAELAPDQLADRIAALPNGNVARDGANTAGLLQIQDAVGKNELSHKGVRARTTENRLRHLRYAATAPLYASGSGNLPAKLCTVASAGIHQ